MATSPKSWAEEGPSLALRKTSTHIALGPQAAGIFVNNAWDSEIGGELHIARLRDAKILSVYGAGLGVAGYSKGETVQVSLDLYAGTDAIGQVPLGISLGPVLKAYRNGAPQLGGRSTLWIYHGVMPYISVSWLRGPNSPAQPGLEIGVKIPFSIWDW